MGLLNHTALGGIFFAFNISVVSDAWKISSELFWQLAALFLKERREK